MLSENVRFEEDFPKNILSRVLWEKSSEIPRFGKCLSEILRFCRLGKCSRNAAQPRTALLHLSSPASCLSHTHTGTEFYFLDTTLQQ